MFHTVTRSLAPIAGLMLLASSLHAQTFVANYDESKVPQFTLPELLVAEDGQAIDDAERWQSKRRPEVLRLFETHVYGKTPVGRPDGMWFEVLEEGPSELPSRPLRRQVRVHFTEEADGPSMDLLLFIPADASGPVPAFLGLNFQGNQSISDDPQVLITESWARPREGVEKNRATEASRGRAASRWPVDTIVGRGYALATVYYGDIDPDFDDGFQNGVHPLFYREGQTSPAADEWGSIGAWAWGLSRALDCLETTPEIDAKRVAVMGHSRLGKTSLWAGAQDERFAIVISNDSGCGGAALSRRAFGETVGRINRSFPHWFCDNFNQYNENEAACPVDQHMLIALAAPRPVYVASAAADRWADPRGEFLSAKHAEPVYALFGLKGLEVDDMPEVDQPVGHSIGYHVRTGRHNVTDFDWEQYLKFADRHLRTATAP